jgi:hypothetical protein
MDGKIIDGVSYDADGKVFGDASLSDNLYDGKTIGDSSFGFDFMDKDFGSGEPDTDTNKDKSGFGLSAMDIANIGLGIGNLAVQTWAAKKNLDLKKDAQNYNRLRDAMADAKSNQFAANMRG